MHRGWTGRASRWPERLMAAAAMIALFLAGPGPVNAAADGPGTARTFLEGVAAYEKGDYGAAVAAFETVAASGIRNPRLCYNLGNAHLKTGDLGPAILWYERALKLSPDDPDLNFNYAYALSLVKDDRGMPEASVYRVLFFWQRLMSPDATAAAALAANGLFWLVAAFRFFRKKKVLKGIALPLLGIALVFTATAFYNYYEAAYVEEGIVLPEKVPVRSGLSEEATELFILHAGAKVDIQDEKEGFFKIYFSEGKIGWVKRSHIGRI